MFVELDLPRAYQRREELRREVRSERLERELRAARRRHRDRRWSLRLFRGIRALYGQPASANRA